MLHKPVLSPYFLTPFLTLMSSICSTLAPLTINFNLKSSVMVPTIKSYFLLCSLQRQNTLLNGLDCIISSIDCWALLFSKWEVPGKACQGFEKSLGPIVFCIIALSLTHNYDFVASSLPVYR